MALAEGNPMALLAGIDGCKKGWIIAIHDTRNHSFEHTLADDFAQVLEITRGFAVVALDMPIGLLDCARKGGRSCDRNARKFLAPKRASSVFNAPARPALSAGSFAQANELNRNSSPDNIGLSMQSFAILPKIKAVDDLMTPDLQKVVKEVHPELCFMEMNNGAPANHSKKKRPGREEREEILKKRLPCCNLDPMLNRRDAAMDDYYDACAGLWTAIRIHKSIAIRIPDEPERDSRGLFMEIWR
jgi:predicted RNase H-like nuclease